MARSSLRRYFRHGMLTQLMVFAAVARAGSVTRAAEELHLAQPTVSMQLRKLSEALDMRLFEHEGRGLRLTESGRAVQALCEELAGVLLRAEARFDGLRKPPLAKLRLAAEPEGRGVAARLLAAFSTRHPGVQASLHVASRADLLERLAAGEDDVYLLELEVEGVPPERRWSLAHPKGRPLAAEVALFLREALLLDAFQIAANNPGPEEDPWKSRGTTTRP